MALIDAEQVETVFRDCFFEEAPDDLSKVKVAEGIMMRVGFNPEKLALHRDEIVEMLNQLPNQFFPVWQGGGGGWSFLQACVDRNEEMWTGMHRTMEMLFLLGIGIDCVQYQAPREAWPILPGGMPYLLVDTIGDPRAVEEPS